MTVVILGTFNLIISYFFLIETKGICLDEIKICNNTNLKNSFTANDKEFSTETFPALIITENKQNNEKN